jgi:hypothetical protein
LLLAERRHHTPRAVEFSGSPHFAQRIGKSCAISAAENRSRKPFAIVTDWASSFPFERLGLPDNYAQLLPSLTLFGFQHDAAFERPVGPRLAGTARLSRSANPKSLRARYTRLATGLKHTPVAVTE